MSNNGIHLTPKQVLIIVMLSLAVVTATFILLSKGCESYEPPVQDDSSSRNTPAPSLRKPSKYEITPGAIMRFAIEKIPATGWCNVIPGMLDTFPVYAKDGKWRFRYSVTVYNSSTRDTFFVNPYNPDGTVDTSKADGSSAKNIIRSQLLNIGGKVIQTSPKTSFSLDEGCAIVDGYPKADIWLAMGPQRVDEYPSGTYGQWFELPDLRPGQSTKLQVEHVFDPLNRYGQWQSYRFTIVWDWDSKRVYAERK